ncbi:MAG: hypothetical protein PVG83_13085 [Acidimicrobiia bacterium]|jgi:hypothetical protein
MTDLQELISQKEDLERERKRLDAIWWAGAFIWIGVTLGAHSLELLPEIGGSSEWWPWIFSGLGVWSLLLNTIRVATDAPNPTTWDWIWTVVFAGVAASAFVDVTVGTVGAAVLIAIGLLVLYRAVARRP